MSVYGGDSWAREAQYRKRRVDDLAIEGVDSSSYRKLPSGKYACLVCPNAPVLDTPIMLRTHMNGSRHRAAASRLRDRELALQAEVNKRIALSQRDSPNPPVNAPVKQRKTATKTKPLIERTRKAASEIFSGQISQTEVKSEKTNLVVHCGEGSSCYGDSVGMTLLLHEAANRRVQPVDYQERLERELKFTAAGWKRDCHGRWFKDENVEFDSDEEDPNIVLNDST